MKNYIYGTHNDIQPKFIGFLTDWIWPSPVETYENGTMATKTYNLPNTSWERKTTIYVINITAKHEWKSQLVTVQCK